MAFAAPLVLFPLFFSFRPLDREALVRRLVALASRVGAPVLGVYEWSLGDRSRTANAALVGLGSTRRILLSDTLLTCVLGRRDRGDPGARTRAPRVR